MKKKFKLYVLYFTLTSLNSIISIENELNQETMSENKKGQIAQVADKAFDKAADIVIKTQNIIKDAFEKNKEKITKSSKKTAANILIFLKYLFSTIKNQINNAINWAEENK